MKQRSLYLSLAVIGLIAPYVVFFVDVTSNQANLATALAHLKTFVANPIGKITMIWFLTSGVALSIFATHEALVRRDYYLFWAIPVTILAGIGAALPFYLYLRSPK